MKVSSVSIFVLNYNGIPLLKECLPTLEAAADQARVPVRLVVIDNQSPQDDIAFLREHFPRFEVFRAPSNDFLISFNQYVREDSADLALLLNNDIKVEADFLLPLIELFESRPDAFFASSYCLDFTKQHYEGGLSRLVKRGGIWGTRSVPPEVSAAGPQITASIGAAIAIRRDRFLELGGFDRVYLPGTLEDLDLCYRGWKRGWKGYYVPGSRIYHKGQASFRPAFGRDRIRTMACRNTFFFMWKNIHDPRLMTEHLLLLGPRLLWALLRGDFSFAAGLGQALRRLPEILPRRRAAREGTVLSDREILRLTGGAE